MGVGLEVAYPGINYAPLPRRAVDEASVSWPKIAVSEAYSVLAREGRPPHEAIKAWAECERLAQHLTGDRAYYLATTVVFSPYKPAIDGSEWLIQSKLGVKSGRTPVVTYHFGLPSPAGAIVSRYALEQIGARDPQDGERDIIPRSVKELNNMIGPWTALIRDRSSMNSARPYIVAAPEPRPDQRPRINNVTAYLLARAMTVAPRDIQKLTEPLQLSPDAISQLARYAVSADVTYIGETYQQDNVTAVASVHNPRYGAWQAGQETGENEALHELTTKPGMAARLGIMLNLVPEERYPSLRLSAARQGSPAWKLPEELQMIDFESPAGKIVMEVARKHMTRPIAAARVQQIQDARKMTAFAQSISPADAP
jgi:hypothetical protein